MRFWQLLAIAILAWAAPVQAATPDAPLDWLTGNWRSDSADGRWAIEEWEAAPDGTMIGSGSSGKGAATGSSEAMRISLRGGTAVFTASPNGAPPVDFREIARGSRSITFENPSHDYPQRIRYWRDGEALAAETSLKDGGQPMRWTYVRSAPQSAAATSAQPSTGHLIQSPEAIVWADAPASLPPGAKSALLYGNPSGPDLFVMRVWFPKGYRLPPHVHPADEVVTVISGQYLMGYGTTADGRETHRLTAGTFLATSPNIPHYAQFEEDTVLQLNTIGPWGLTYVDPKDDPRNAAR